MMMINHPLRPSATIEGEILKPGEVLRDTDYYASTTGKWESCPCPGGKVREGLEVIWVRPN